MSKESALANSVIDPSKVVWKYFTLDENGTVISSDEKPEDLPALAILAASLWPSGQTFSRRNTPSRIKGIIQNTLNQDLDGRKPRFCVAVPCTSMEKMIEYYGAENVERMKSTGIAEIKTADLAGKVIISHLSFKDISKGTTPVTDAYQIINSESLRSAKFVVLSLTIPEIFVGEERPQYLENQNDIFRKLFADFQIDKPVFITTNSPDQKKLRPIFEANIDLEKALAPIRASTPRSEVEQLIVKQLEAQMGGK
jgi:hypothetical protein